RRGPSTRAARTWRSPRRTDWGPKSGPEERRARGSWAAAAVPTSATCGAARHGPVVDHQAAVLDDQHAAAGQRFRRPVVADPALQPDGARLLGQQVGEMRRDIAGAAEDVDDVELARYVGHAPVDLLAEDLRRFRVVDRHRNDL